jgi:hypothetical protein
MLISFGVLMWAVNIWRGCGRLGGIGVRRGADALALELRLLLRQVTYLESQVTELDQEINRRYGELDAYLLTILGLGAATAPAIYAKLTILDALQTRISWWPS